jgi:ABC-2 type transport system ATP-binding protein
VREGQVSGFLGPNGAWKTTTVEMVPGLTRPGSGSVLINGEGLSTRPHELKRLVGHLPERVAFYENLTALQTLEFFAEVERLADRVAILDRGRPVDEGTVV